MPTTITEQVQLVVLNCGKCGVTFAVPERFDKERQRTGGDFYCPNGHSRVYRESEVEMIQRQLVALPPNHMPSYPGYMRQKGKG